MSGNSASSNTSGKISAWAPAIGGALGAVGGIFGSSKSSSSAKHAVAAQIAWERERAKNAHQWEVADLEAAGLNPIISAGGQGAQTAGISAPVPDTSGYADAANSAAIFAQTIKNIEKTDAEKNLINEQINSEKGRGQNIIGKIIPQETIKKLGGGAKRIAETGEEAIEKAKNFANKIKKSWEKDKSKYEKAKNTKEAWNNIMTL